MSVRSLGQLTIDMLLKTGGFETDMGRAAKIAEKNAKQIQTAMRNTVTGVAKELAAVAGLSYSIAQAWQGFQGAVDAADKVDELSARLGISTETLSGYRYAAQLTGGDLDSLAGAIAKLSKGMAAALDPQSKQAKLFKSLGVEVTDATGQLRKANAVLPEVMDKFKALNNETLETAVAMELFGKSGGELLEFLNLGSSGLDQMSEKARTLGGIIDGETAAAAAKFRDETDNMALAMEGLYLGIAAELLPAMTEVTRKFTAFASDGEKVAEVGQQIGDVMEVVGGVFEFVTPYFVAADQAIKGTTWAFMGLYEAAQGVIDLNWDQVKRGLSLSQHGVRTGGMAATYGLGANLYGSSDTDGNPRPKATIIDPADLIADDKRRVAAIRAQREESKRLMALLGDDEGRSEKSRKDAAARAKEQAAEDKKRAESIERFGQQAKLAAAALSGPYAEALAKAEIQTAEWRKEVEAGNMRQSDMDTLVKASTDALEKQRVEMEKQQKAPQALLDTMSGELRMLSLLGPARERYQRQLQNETDMRRAIADAQKAGLELSADQIAALLSQARAFADWSIQVEDATAAAEQWAGILVGGIGDASGAFADFLADGASDFDGFFDELGDIAKRGLADLIRQFLQTKIVIPIQTQILNGLSGQGGTGFWSSLMGMFSGNGFAASGQNAGNWASLLGSGNGGMLSSLAGLFGGGSSASTGAAGAKMAAKMAGKGLGGAAGSTGAMSGLTGAMGSVASFMPWAALIMAGMQMAGDAYGEGFGLEHQDRGDLLLRGNLSTGGLATPLMLDSMSLDVIGRALGMDRKTAAIFSGSSLLGKAFGRSAPKVTASGITGSYGFDGFDGQSYADIKQKGGWFRSDKKWTQYDVLDGSIDRMLDSAAGSVSTGIQQLAKQIGTDVSQQLAGVHVNIGKLQLDADPEKAQQQIEALISDMVGELSAKGIQALGFGHLLDDGFAATDVMSALAASISLVTGSVEGLGRALEQWELTNITKGVEYFMDLAEKNGTTLQEEVTRVSGLLDGYSGLISDVQGELLTAGLNDYQRAALDIETTYRQQVKAANEYAKALGLTGARAEDLAKIEELRAHNMAALQLQIERQRDDLLGGLAMSEYSPLTDQQKLAEGLQQLEDAVAAGDISAAASLSQSVLGLGRNLFASGRDYNDLYEQVTDMIGGIGVPDLVMDDGTTMGDLADILLGLPTAIGQAVFAAASGAIAPLPPGTVPTAPVVSNPVGGGGAGGGIGGGIGGGVGTDTQEQILQTLRAILERQTSADLRASLNR